MISSLFIFEFRFDDRVQTMRVGGKVHFAAQRDKLWDPLPRPEVLSIYGTTMSHVILYSPALIGPVICSPPTAQPFPPHRPVPVSPHSLELGHVTDCD